MSQGEVCDSFIRNDCNDNQEKLASIDLLNSVNSNKTIYCNNNNTENCDKLIILSNNDHNHNNYLSVENELKVIEKDEIIPIFVSVNKHNHTNVNCKNENSEISVEISNCFPNKNNETKGSEANENKIPNENEIVETNEIIDCNSNPRSILSHCSPTHQLNNQKISLRKKSVSFDTNEECVKKFVVGEEIVDKKNPFIQLSLEEPNYSKKLIKRSKIGKKTSIPTPFFNSNSKTSKVKDDEFITKEEVLKQSKYVTTYVKNPDKYLTYDKSVIEKITSLRKQKKEDSALKPVVKKSPVPAPRQSKLPLSKEIRETHIKNTDRYRYSESKYPDLSDIKVKTGTDLEESLYDSNEVAINVLKFDSRFKKGEFGSQDDIDEIADITSANNTCDENDETDHQSSSNSVKSKKTFSNTVNSSDFQDYLKENGLFIVKNKSAPKSALNSVEELEMDNKSEKKRSVLRRIFQGSLFSSRSKTTPKEDVPQASYIKSNDVKQNGIKRVVLERSSFHGGSNRSSVSANNEFTKQFSVREKSKRNFARSDDKTSSISSILTAAEDSTEETDYTNKSSSNLQRLKYVVTKPKLVVSKRPQPNLKDKSNDSSCIPVYRDIDFNRAKLNMNSLENARFESNKPPINFVRDSPLLSTGIIRPKVQRPNILLSSLNANHETIKNSTNVVPKPPVPLRRSSERKSLMTKGSNYNDLLADKFKRTQSMDREEIIRRSLLQRLPEIPYENNDSISQIKSVPAQVKITKAPIIYNENANAIDTKTPSNSIEHLIDGPGQTSTPKNEKEYNNQLKSTISPIQRSPAKFENNSLPKHNVEINPYMYIKLHELKKKTDEELYIKAQASQSSAPVQTKNVYARPMKKASVPHENQQNHIYESTAHAVPQQREPQILPHEQYGKLINSSFVRNSSQRNTISGDVRYRQLHNQNLQNQNVGNSPAQYETVPYTQPTRSHIVDDPTSFTNPIYGALHGQSPGSAIGVVRRRDSATLDRKQVLQGIYDFYRRSVSNTPIKVNEAIPTKGKTSSDTSPISYASVNTVKSTMDYNCAVPEVPKRIQSLSSQPSYRRVNMQPYFEPSSPSCYSPKRVTFTGKTEQNNRNRMETYSDSDSVFLPEETNGVDAQNSSIPKRFVIMDSDKITPNDVINYGRIVPPTTNTAIYGQTKHSGQSQLSDFEKKIQHNHNIDNLYAFVQKNKIKNSNQNLAERPPSVVQMRPSEFQNIHRNNNLNLMDRPASVMQMRIPENNHFQQNNNYHLMDRPSSVMQMRPQGSNNYQQNNIPNFIERPSAIMHSVEYNNNNHIPIQNSNQNLSKRPSSVMQILSPIESQTIYQHASTVRDRTDGRTTPLVLHYLPTQRQRRPQNEPVYRPIILAQNNVYVQQQPNVPFNQQRLSISHQNRAVVMFNSQELLDKRSGSNMIYQTKTIAEQNAPLSLYESESGSEAEVQHILQNRKSEEDWQNDKSGRSQQNDPAVDDRRRAARSREDPRRHTLGGDMLHYTQGQGGTLPRSMDLEAPPMRSYTPTNQGPLFDDDPGIMSEVETASTGFRRGGKQRSSLPVVRTPSKTLERPLGLVFLQYRSETKRALLPNEITSIDTVRALFVRSFPRQLTMAYLEGPNVKIYIHDSSKDMFYELEDVRSHLREIRDRSVLRLFESNEVGAPQVLPGGPGIPQPLPPSGGTGHWDQDQSYFSEPEFDSEYQHQHIHKSKTGKAPYYVGSAQTLPRGMYSDRNKNTADGYMSSPERGTRGAYEEPYYSQYGTRGNTVTPIIDEEQGDVSIADDQYSMYGVKGLGRLPRAPNQMYDPTRPEDLHRIRVEHMERQLANLTGLVQKALTQNPQVPTVGNQNYLGVPGQYRGDKSVSFEKSVSFSDDIQGVPKSHSPQHLADSKPPKPAIKSSTLPRTSSQERDRLKPAPPPKPLVLAANQYRADLTLAPEVYNHLRGLQKKAKDLRTEVRTLRRLAQTQAVAVREDIKDTFMRIRATLLTSNGSLWGQGDQERTRLSREEEIYKQEVIRLEKDLGDLESSVEGLRGEVINRRTRVNMAAVEDMALVLSRASKTVAELKMRFPNLQQGLRNILSNEMEKVCREEKFLKEEPDRLESALRRCKKLTGTLVTLKRLASVQEQRLPVPEPQTTEETPRSSEAQQNANKPIPSPRLGTITVSGGVAPENALDALLDELQTFAKPPTGCNEPRPDDSTSDDSSQTLQNTVTTKISQSQLYPSDPISTNIGLRRLHSYPSGSDTDTSPPQPPRPTGKPPVPERNADLLSKVNNKRVPPPPPPRTSSRSPLASPTSPNLPQRRQSVSESDQQIQQILNNSDSLLKDSGMDSSSESVSSDNSQRQLALELRHQELLKKQKQLQEQYQRLQQMSKNNIPLAPGVTESMIKKTGSESNLPQKMGLNMSMSGSMKNLSAENNNLITETQQNDKNNENTTNPTKKVYETDIL